MSRKHMLNFGSLNLDAVYQVNHFVCAGETVSALSETHFPGGKGLNQSIALSRAGAPVAHAGKIGPDGARLRDILERDHVDCGFLFTNGSATGKAIIQRDTTGQNCIISYGGANHEITEDEITRVLEEFGQGDFVLSQNEISHVPFLVEKAAARGMEIILNPSPVNDALKSVPLDKVSWLVINEIEGKALSGSQAAEDILLFFQRHYPRLHVVLTLGHLGSIYSGPLGYYSQPAYTVPVTDTTAAGDTFLGFFFASLFHGCSIPEALNLAAAAAALAVTKSGSVPSIPTIYEVKDFLKASNKTIKVWRC